MLLFMTLDQALQLIENSSVLFAEQVIPAQVTISVDSPYRPEYGWLFTYEREIARRLEPWLAPYRYELIGEQGIICEALSNAFCHGHLKDKFRPIEITCQVGRKGLVLQIKDQGKGFDVQRLHRQYQAGKTYYQIAGNGLRHMFLSKNFGVFFTHSGAAFHLLRCFNQEQGFLRFWEKTM